jgi:hypothetical protein
MSNGLASVPAVDSYRHRRELPPPTEPAISHPATRRAVRLRLWSAATLAVLAVALIAGAVLVVQHRHNRERQLAQIGVVVPGRVTSQPFYTTKDGGYWGDEVQWTFDRQSYDDATTLTNGQLSALPPVGAVVPVVVDRHDPS